MRQESRRHVLAVVPALIVLAFVVAACSGEPERESAVQSVGSALTAGPRTVAGTPVTATLATSRALADLAPAGRSAAAVRQASPAHQGQVAPLPFVAPPLGAAATLAAATAVASPPPAATFLATSDTFWTPPDTDGTVGPNHLVVAVNGAFVVQSKTGVELFRVALSDFFAPVSHGTFFVFDPVARYDPGAGRFMIVAQAHFLDVPQRDSGMLIAVSQSSDPTLGWNFYRIEIDPINLFAWGDFPKIGFNQRWIVATTNVIDSATQGAMIVACDKAVLYAGGPATCTRFDTFTFTVNPATTYDANVTTQYLGHNENAFLGTVSIDTITGPVGGEVLTLGARIVSLPATWGDFRFIGPQAGTTDRQLDTGFSWVNALVYRNGSLWGAQLAGVQLPGSHTTVQWWQMTPSGILQQFGRIEDPAGIRFFVYPSMAVNKNNDVLVGYSRYAPDQFPSANYAFRSGSDPLNSMRDDTVFKAGESIYCPGCTQIRWGDYSMTSVDPANDVDLWTIQESAAANSQWATSWAKIVPPAPVVVGPVADAYVRDGSSAGSNFGTATTLQVNTQTGAGNTRIAYLRFPLSSVPSAVTGARLRLFGSRPAATSLTDSAFAVANTSWSETGINFNNRPALGALQGVPVTVGTAAQYYEWDVSAFVKSQKAAGASAVSLAVRMDGNSSGGVDTFNSREASANRPQLVVTTGGPPIDNPPTVAQAASAVPNPAPSTDSALSVLGADDHGEGALTYFWSVQDPAPGFASFSVNENNAAKHTAIFFSAAGTYQVKALIRDERFQTATSNLTLVVNQSLTTVLVSPGTATVPTGGTLQFNATAYDQFFAPLTVQPSFSWSVSGGGTISATGRFTAGSTAGGPFTVTATAQGKSGTASVTVAAPTTTTFTPAADAYVRDGSSANSNFGTATTLQVKSQSGAGNTRIAYLRFPLPTSVGANVTVATLRLFGSRPGTSSVTDSAFAINSNQWTETGITFNSRPPLGAVQGPGRVITSTSQFYEWDVTSFVRATRSSGITEVSLAVAMDASTTLNPDTFNSREAGSNRPQLVVTSTP